MSLFSFIFGDEADDSAMAESKAFRIKFDGEAFVDHSIEVNDLAPSLLSLSDLLKEANFIANKDRTSISIKVKATETGCFQIVISALQTALDDSVHLLAGEKVSNVFIRVHRRVFAHAIEHKFSNVLCRHAWQNPCP